MASWIRRASRRCRCGRPARDEGDQAAASANHAHRAATVVARQFAQPKAPPRRRRRGSRRARAGSARGSAVGGRQDAEGDERDDAATAPSATRARRNASASSPPPAAPKRTGSRRISPRRRGRARDVVEARDPLQALRRVARARERVQRVAGDDEVAEGQQRRAAPAPSRQSRTPPIPATRDRPPRTACLGPDEAGSASSEDGAPGASPVSTSSAPRTTQVGTSTYARAKSSTGRRVSTIAAASAPAARLTHASPSR
jgi:hypothetical protein